MSEKRSFTDPLDCDPVVHRDNPNGSWRSAVALMASPPSHGPSPPARPTTVTQPGRRGEHRLGVFSHARAGCAYPPETRP